MPGAERVERKWRITANGYSVSFIIDFREGKGDREGERERDVDLLFYLLIWLLLYFKISFIYL